MSAGAAPAAPAIGAPPALGSENDSSGLGSESDECGGINQVSPQRINPPHRAAQSPTPTFFSSDSEEDYRMREAYIYESETLRLLQFAKEG